MSIAISRIHRSFLNLRYVKVYEMYLQIYFFLFLFLQFFQMFRLFDHSPVFVCLYPFFQVLPESTQAKDAFLLRLNIKRIHM